MTAKGLIVLIFTLAAIAIGFYILSAAATGASFAFGGEIIPGWAPIPIAAILAIVFGWYFFASRRKER
jgi:hypothetical protein